MSKKKHAPEANLAFLAGLYTRVARRTGVHPSYVSRVARGERRSESVSRALKDELAQFVPARAVAKTPATENVGSSEEYRQRVIRRLREHAQLARLRATVMDLESWGSPKERTQVSRASLQSRIVANAPMIAASMEQFHRMSRKLERFAHVLSLTDNEGVILYSVGPTGRLHTEARIPGVHWGHDQAGPSAAAKAITAGVPVIIVGRPQNQGLLPVRMGCPIRLADGETAGVIVLSIDLSPSRAEKLLEIVSLARKICKIVEAERKKPSRSRANAEHHVPRMAGRSVRARSAKAPGA